MCEGRELYLPETSIKTSWIIKYNKCFKNHYDGDHMLCILYKSESSIKG